MRIYLKLFLIIIFTITTILVHWYSIDKSSQGRNIIWEPDDNYHQLIKAKNMDSCYRNCLAINNLLKYDPSNFNDTQKYQHDMYLHHTAVEYHYLKSKILQISNKYFDDWEKTHLFITKIATSILVISFIILITTLFNINIGLISSIIIIPYVTIGYGFHFTNGAHDLAQIFGIFSIVALKGKKILNYFYSFILSILAIFTHPIGIIILAFNFVFLFFRDKELINKNKVLYFFLSLILIIFYFRLDLNYLNDQFKFLDLYNSFELSYSGVMELIIQNLKGSAYFVYDLFNLLNFLILIIILLFLKRDVFKIFQKYKYLKPLLIASIFIVLISLIHYAPEATIITRMQQILTVSILSLYSVLIYEFIIKIKVSTHKNKILSAIVIIFVSQSIYNFYNLNLKIKSNQQTLNLDLNLTEINKIKKNLKNDKPIVFKQNNSDFSSYKSIYYKFLLEGFNEKNIFLNELLSKNDKSKLLNKNFLLIMPSPIINNNLILKEKRPDCFDFKTFIKCIERGWYGHSRSRMSDLLIKNEDYLEINTDQKINELYLNINSFKNNIILKDENNKIINLNTVNQSNWLKIKSSEFNFNKINFLMPDNKFVKLNGIKVKLSDNTWPWNNKIKINHFDNKILRNLNFNLKEMIGEYYCKDYDLISDNSSFIIIEMKCQ